jgi:hypothetical protein
MLLPGPPHNSRVLLLLQILSHTLTHSLSHSDTLTLFTLPFLSLSLSLREDAREQQENDLHAHTHTHTHLICICTVCPHECAYVWKEEEEKENEGTSQGQHAVDAIAADTSFLARRIALLPAAPAHLRERERERERGGYLYWINSKESPRTSAPARFFVLLCASLCFFVLAL